MTAPSRRASRPAFADWPELDRLGRFSDLLAHLGSLPERVGPVDLTRLRDIALPLPVTWPGAVNPLDSLDVPPGVDAGWLAETLHEMGSPCDEALLDVPRMVRRWPDWTLTAIWLLESALAWPDVCGDRPPGLSGAARGELGDLYCQTGDIVQGVHLLDDGRELLGRDDARYWHFAYRAARWIALLNPAAATDRLRQLHEDEAAPASIRLRAELELLGHSREQDLDTHALMDRARQADELVLRAANHPLDERELRALRTRALHLSGRWLGASRIRSLRTDGRDRLLEALHECSQRDDYRGLSQVLDTLGRAHLRLGSFRHARDAFEESILLKQKLRDLWGLGGSLTGLAECLLAAGQARESLPCFQVNLLLLEALGCMQVLFVRNLARHLNALVAAGCDPLETTPSPPDLLELARELLARYTSFVARPSADPYCLLLEGGYRRLAARNAVAAHERLEHVEAGVQHAESARQRFAQQGNWLRSCRGRPNTGGFATRPCGGLRESGR